MRVISLVPSVTESLLAWDVVPIACTRFCEQPDLLHVGGTKDPDLDAVIELAPDLVVMCEEENLKVHHEQLVAAGLKTYTVRIDGIEDVARDLAGLAEAVGVDVDLAGFPHADASGESAGAVVGHQEPWIRAFVPIWRRPWMTLNGGTYGSSMLAHLGVVNVFADHETRYPEVTPDEIRHAAPDVVLAPTEPYPFAERHLADLRELAPACLVDGQDLFWWGTRTVAAIDRLRISLDRLKSAGPRPTDLT